MGLTVRDKQGLGPHVTISSLVHFRPTKCGHHVGSGKSSCGFRGTQQGEREGLHFPLAPSQAAQRVRMECPLMELFFFFFFSLNERQVKITGSTNISGIDLAS